MLHNALHCPLMTTIKMGERLAMMVAAGALLVLKVALFTGESSYTAVPDNRMGSVAPVSCSAP